MALTGSKLIHAHSSVASAVPTSGQMVAGQIAINSADKVVFIKDSTNAIVAVASALAVTKALSAVQTVNGLSPTAGAVVVGPGDIGTFGVAPLDAGGKVSVAYLPAAVLGNVDYIGSWDASTDTPTLPDPTTVKGNYYVTSVAGTQTGAAFDGGSLTFAIGDWVISNGVVWQKVTSESAVSSVNGQTGIVVLTASDVSALALSGGTMTGAIDMGTHKITNLGAPTANADAATKLYVDTAVSGVGTVTSVDVTSNSSVLTSTGGPVTTSGSITLDFATQAKNKVFAGPVSGSDAVPTFRVLDSADLVGLTLDEGTYA